MVKDGPSKLDTFLEWLERNTPLSFLRAPFLNLLTREVYSANGFRTLDLVVQFRTLLGNTVGNEMTGDGLEYYPGGGRSFYRKPVKPVWGILTCNDVSCN